MSILNTIKAHKMLEITALKSEWTEAALRRATEDVPLPRGFINNIVKTLEAGNFALIAEIKKASPSKGVIRNDFDVAQIAADYEEGGAACLSILTDAEFFQGAHSYIREAQANSSLPVLRKDFLFDPIQVLQSRALGADCVLLILSTLEQQQADELEALALNLGMDVLLECHDVAELNRALGMQSQLIGINNRDLATFDASLTRTEILAPLVGPGKIIVSESGLSGTNDLQRLSCAGVNTFLIGEILMRAPDIRSATMSLLERSPEVATITDGSVNSRMGI